MDYLESDKIYMGSAFNLSERMYNYFLTPGDPGKDAGVGPRGIKILERYKTVYIYNALLLHEYSTFSLTILEYIDISDLS
jgi:hypothetical protein